jgi:hypothetical protein
MEHRNVTSYDPYTDDPRLKPIEVALLREGDAVDLQGDPYFAHDETDGCSCMHTINYEYVTVAGAEKVLRRIVGGVSVSPPGTMVHFEGYPSTFFPPGHILPTLREGP